MDESPHGEGGLFSTVARLLKTLRDVVENRGELFLLELKEERLRFFEALVLFAVMVVCALLALGLVTLTVVVIFWETHRLLVLGLVTLAYAAAATAAFAKLRYRLKHWQAYSKTLEQLKKDCACFKPKN